MSNAPTLQVRVARKTPEAQDIVTLELVPVDAQTLPAFSAGSHVDVHLPGAIIRQYSLCNDPQETHRYQIGVLRDAVSRGGSAAVHDQVQEGDVLTISAPRNHFALVPDAHRHLLLAGGIGVTPLLCMAERLAHTGADFEMHYATRSPQRTAFRGRIAARPYAASVHLHHDDGDAAQKLNLSALLATPQPGTHVYVCGPRGFMDAALGTARSAGWPEAQLHYEFFGAEVARSDSDAGFEIQLASSGRVIMVPRDQTVVQALAEAGVDIMVSCEQGVCGTCLTRVLEGVPDHKDSYLTPQEQAANDQFTPCCSRSKSPRLVLEL
jgi:vanillate monooxygenase ferredoxin subunit